MKRGSIWVVCIMVLFILLWIGSEFITAKEGSYTIFMNGERLNVETFVKDGVVYLPVQAIASKLQLSIEWNPGLNLVKINDQIVDATPHIKNGIVFLPVESVAQSINAVVKWDGKESRLQIDAQLEKLAPQKRSGNYSGIRVGPKIPIPKVSNVDSTVDSTVSSNSTCSKGQQEKISPATDSVGSQIQSGIDDFPYPSTSAYPGSSLPPKNPASEYPQDIYRKKSALAPGGIPLDSNYYNYPQTTASESLKNTMPQSEPFLQPLHAPPSMPDGLKLPTTGPEYYSDKIKNPSIPAELYSTPAYPHAGGFIPKQAENKIFSITVTNMEQLRTIKNFYHPHAGSKYVVIYVTQKNISDKVQVYTGKFSLVDGDNRVYDYLERLSNFWLVILKPGALNFGYLVFEVPDGAMPSRLVLHALNQEPLIVGLQP